VDVWFRDGTILFIICTKFEQAVAGNVFQRSELDYLIYNDPEAYVDLVSNGDPKAFLWAVTEQGVGGVREAPTDLFRGRKSVTIWILG